MQMDKESNFDRRIDQYICLVPFRFLKGKLQVPLLKVNKYAEWFLLSKPGFPSEKNINHMVSEVMLDGANPTHLSNFPVLADANTDNPMIEWCQVELLSPQDHQSIIARESCMQLKWFNVALNEKGQLQIHIKPVHSQFEIMQQSLIQLRNTVELKQFNAIRQLIGDEFTLNDLKRCLGALQPIYLTTNNSNLRRKLNKYIVPTARKQVGNPGHPSKIYQWRDEI